MLLIGFNLYLVNKDSSGKVFSTYAILLAQAVIIFAVQNIWLKHIVAILLLAILILMNIREIKIIANKAKSVLKRKLSKSEE